MSNIIQNLEDITDSKELIEAKPHKFTSIFAYGLIAMLFIALVWSYFGQIDIVTKTTGVIKSVDKTMTVLNEVEGKVTKVNFKEGQKVKKGDTLYKIDCKDAVLNKENYEKQLEILEADLKNTTKLKKSIMEEKNYFTNNNDNDLEFYNKYMQYRTTSEKLTLSEKQTTLQIDSSNENNIMDIVGSTDELNKNQELMNNLNTLLDSIQNHKNNFSDESLYSNEYRDYEYSLKEFENSIKENKLQVEKSKNEYESNMNDLESEIDKAKIAYDNSLLELQQYKSSSASDITDDIINEEDSLKETQSDNSNYNKKIETTKNSIENLEKLKQSIENNENLFQDKSSKYYKQYLDYKNDIDSYTNNEQKEKYKNSYILKVIEEMEQEKSTLDELQSQQASTNSKNDSKNDNINKLKKLKDAINSENDSEVDKDYHDKYENYINKIKELENDIKAQKNALSTLKKKRELAIDSYKNELEIIQNTLDNATAELSKFTNKLALDIKTKIKDTSDSIKKIGNDLDKLRIIPELDNVNKALATNEVVKYKIDTLVELDNTTKENELKIDELKTNIDTLQFNIDKSNVKATIDGVINVKKDISKGELVPAGTEILSVIPQNDSQYKVQLYVSNKDISGIKVGQQIKYHFDALPYKEYGELKGKITDIATDSMVDQNTGISYYLVESEIKNEPLFSYKGEKGELKLGMTCEAQVVTKQKKILYYLLEKINLKN